MTNEEFHDALYRERCRREDVERKLNEAIAAEREACAKLCEEANLYKDVSGYFAAKIRGRSL